MAINERFEAMLLPTFVIFIIFLTKTIAAKIDEACIDKEEYCEWGPDCDVTMVKENCPKYCNLCDRFKSSRPDNEQGIAVKESTKTPSLTKDILISQGSNPATSRNASIQVDKMRMQAEIENEGKGCWEMGKCNQIQGKCSWCGSMGYCCRKNYDDHSNGCDGTFGGENDAHVCVKPPVHLCGKE